MDAEWMPVEGRHEVAIGASLGRALRARKGAVNAPKRNIPDRNFHACRYNFKPESIDSTRPGTMEVKKNGDLTTVAIECPSTQTGKSHLFAGPETTAKEWECVLIYDEELGHFTLEKVDSFLTLSYDRHATASTPGPFSPAPATPSQASTLKEPDPQLSFEAELERDLLGSDDAAGEPDDDFEEIVSLAMSAPMPVRMEEEEEEEGEVLPSPPMFTPQPRRAAQPVPKPSAPPKPNPPKFKGKGKREHDPGSGDVEEEDLEFGQPSRQTKRTKHSPAEDLALPSSSLTSQSSNPISLSLPLPSAAPASDSEEEWDEIAGSSTQRPLIEVEAEGEEIDENLLNEEMNMELGEGDDIDFLAAAVTPEPEPSRPVMSLNQFAGGGPLDDEDYSSTDESDDD